MKFLGSLLIYKVFFNIMSYIKTAIILWEIKVLLKQIIIIKQIFYFVSLSLFFSLFLFLS